MRPMAWIGYRVCFILLALSAALPAGAATAAKDEALRRTMAQISLLNGQMAQRRGDAIDLREALSAALKELAAEVRQEAAARGIKTAAEALAWPRTHFNLRLMADIQAYIDRYGAVVGYYRVACDRLSYLYQQADDLLKIVNTLSGMKIDALVTQAEKVLDELLPSAQTLVIEPQRLVPPPPEKIWERFTAGG